MTLRAPTLSPPAAAARDTIAIAMPMRAMALLALSIVLAFGTAARAESAAGENLIRRSHSGEATTQPTTQMAGVATGGDSSGTVGSTLRVVLALGVVLALIIGLKMGAGKYLGIRSAGPNANRGVRVLSRTLMGHRQQLVLLQVGRKLVLVSDSSGTVSTVTEITDPDEVAELAAQAQGSSTSASTGSSFNSRINKQAAQYEDEYLESDDDSQPAEPREEKNVDLSGLAAKVRHLNRQFT